MPERFYKNKWRKIPEFCRIFVIIYKLVENIFPQRNDFITFSSQIYDTIKENEVESSPDREMRSLSKASSIM
ncbi:MAG TPA: hypothetical protein IAB89_01730 [Candidatus Caccousia avicola]|mgnify:FL=1|uniref:Uncharacterized protein n=1 Tax=Candidatus Caccousia avicola TaxID=2840721 RepID=A0A9D1AL04_9FIRM|nr:hypothetical protein [Candidatus Caccousia avicola]